MQIFNSHEKYISYYGQIISITLSGSSQLSPLAAHPSYPHTNSRGQILKIRLPPITLKLATSLCATLIGVVLSSWVHPFSCTPYLLSCLTGHIQKNHDSSMVTTLSRKFLSSTHCPIQSLNMSNQRCFCSAINDFGTIQAHSFLIWRSSVIRHTVSQLIPSISEM